MKAIIVGLLVILIATTVVVVRADRDDDDDEDDEDVDFDHFKKQAMANAGECLKKIRKFFAEDRIGKKIADLAKDILKVLQKFQKQMTKEVSGYLKDLKD